MTTHANQISKDSKMSKSGTYSHQPNDQVER